MNLYTKKSVTTITLVLVLVAATFTYFYLTGSQNEVKKYKVGIFIIQDLFLVSVDGFKDGMKELGYEEGKNIEYVLKNTKGDAKLNAQYQDEMIADNLDVLYVMGTTAIGEFKAKNVPFPVVFSALTNSEGIVDNLLKPEGNYTGIMTGAAKFADKRLDMLKKIDPSVKKVIIAVKKDPSYKLFMESIQNGAKNLGLEIVEFQVKDIKEFLARLPEILNRKNGDAFMFYPGPANSSASKAERKIIIDRLISEKILSINHQATGGAEEGILASYGNDRYNIGQQASAFVDKVLKGTPIKEIPVVYETGITLELNLATAKALGVEIPKEIILQAKKTYETY